MKLSWKHILLHKMKHINFKTKHETFKFKIKVWVTKLSNLVAQAGLCIRWPQCPSGTPCTPPCRPPAPRSTLQWVCPWLPRTTRNNPSLPLQVGLRSSLKCLTKIHPLEFLSLTLSLCIISKEFLSRGMAMVPELKGQFLSFPPQCFNPLLTHCHFCKN